MMSETPKKIYKSRNYERDFLGLFGFWADRDSGNCTAYIRADLVARMREALESIAGLADTYVVCNPGQCRDCDLLADIGKTATAALEEVKDE